MSKSAPLDRDAVLPAAQQLDKSSRQALSRTEADADADVSIVSSFEDDDAAFARKHASRTSLSPSKLKRFGSTRGNGTAISSGNGLRKHGHVAHSNARPRSTRVPLVRQASSPAWFAPVAEVVYPKSPLQPVQNNLNGGFDDLHAQLAASKDPVVVVAPQAVRPVAMTDEDNSKTVGADAPAVELLSTPKGKMIDQKTVATTSAPAKPVTNFTSHERLSSGILTLENPTLRPHLRSSKSAWGPSLSSRGDSLAIQSLTSRRASAGNVHEVSEPGTTLIRSSFKRDDARERHINGVTSQSPGLAPPLSPTKASDKPTLKQSSSPLSNADSSTKPPQPSTSSKLPGRRGSVVDEDTKASIAPFSLWEYLKEEVMATDFDSTQEMKWERVTNFVAVPWWVEKIIIFGFVICLDSFLYTFTILPLRFLVAVILWFRNLVWNTTSRPAGSAYRYLHSSHKCDILKTALVILSCFILSRLTDASKMYHSVRGQDVVKLYVIFNVMEIADRLCCSLGQDLLDALFSRMTLARRKDGSQPLARPFAFFLMALLYIQAHTMVLFYQLVTLNVAINSYDNALLTLLLSNQFVEIKGSVFKKFEKENLFQLTCADIVERFQLTLILTAIGVRNLIEVSGGYGSSSSGEVPLPRSFTVLPSLSLLETSFAPVAIVLLSECLVDWLKHAFITKFNHIRPAVYGRFMDVLCRDLVVAGPATSQANGGRSKRRHTFVDQSPVVSRRLGFAALPLACLLVRVSAQIWSMLADDSHFDECAAPSGTASGTSQTGGLTGSILSGLVTLARVLMGGFGVRDAQSWAQGAVDGLLQAVAWILTAFVGWVFLVAIKLLLGASLISFASYRYRTMAAREAEEDLNARDRPAIGVDRHEREYEAKARQLLASDDASAKATSSLQDPSASSTVAGSGVKKGGGSTLMDVNRYTMIKSRLW